MSDDLEKQLMRHEGFVGHAYEDTEGYLTIGIGRLIDKRRNGAITVEEARFLLRNDIEDVFDALDQHIPWWRRQSYVRRIALANMAFNLGIHGLLSFRNMLSALRQGEHDAAAAEALDSKWSRQVGRRADEIATMIREDELP